MTRINPYQPNTFEYDLWETWNRSFFQQPVHAQIMDVEHQLRAHIHALTVLARTADAGDLRDGVADAILAIELRAEELNEIAEHQFVAIVKPNGPRDDDLESARIA